MNYNKVIMTLEFSIETEIEERSAKQILAQGGECSFPVNISCGECPFYEGASGCITYHYERVEVLKLMGVRL